MDYCQRLAGGSYQIFKYLGNYRFTFMSWSYTIMMVFIKQNGLVKNWFSFILLLARRTTTNSLFICFITSIVNHLKNGNFGLLIMYHFILAVTDTQRMMTISSLNQILAANMLLSNFQAKRVNLIPKSYIFYNIAAMLRCGKLTLSRVQLSIVGNFNYTWPCLPVVPSLL